MGEREITERALRGFLPVIVNVTPYLKYGQDNVIAVWADNSDDPSYPPGKTQDMLDFAYFGGIYRDCWMIVHNNVFITDPNYENETAGGGLFVSYDKVSDMSAEVCVDTHVRNVSGKRSGEKLYVNCMTVITGRFSVWKKLSINNGKAGQTSGRMEVKAPICGPRTRLTCTGCMYM